MDHLNIAWYKSAGIVSLLKTRINTIGWAFVLRRQKRKEDTFSFRSKCATNRDYDLFFIWNNLVAQSSREKNLPAPSGVLCAADGTGNDLSYLPHYHWNDTAGTGKKSPRRSPLRGCPATVCSEADVSVAGTGAVLVSTLFEWPCTAWVVLILPPPAPSLPSSSSSHTLQVKICCRLLRSSAH